MKRYNILCLTQDFFVGGAELMLFNLLKHIDKKRFNCILCCRRTNGRVIKLFKKTGVRIETIDGNKKISIQLKDMIDRHKIDIAYITTYKALPEAILLKGLGCKIVYHMYNLLSYTHRACSKKERQKFLKMIFCLSDKIVACSKTVKAQFDFLSPGRNIVLIYNGIDMSQLLKLHRESLLKKEYNISYKTKIMAIVGRIEPQKRQEVFIRQYKDIVSRYQDIVLLIVGRCESKKYLKKIKSLIKRLSLEKNIIITGFKEDVSNVMQDIDILVLPSVDESFNLSLLEAMACGKAVIATNTGGNPELIKHNRTGILVPPNKKNCFVRPALSLLEDNKKATAIGRRAQIAVRKRYGIRTFTKNMESVWR
jgi:glycosyltransferase involved in cell wall biosynthesis